MFKFLFKLKFLGFVEAPVGVFKHFVLLTRITAKIKWKYFCLIRSEFYEIQHRAPKNSIWAPTKKFNKSGLPVIYCFGLMHDFYIKVKKSSYVHSLEG